MDVVAFIPYTEVNTMRINHNISAMITQTALGSNNSAMSKSLEKLSTGLRVNRAQDDAAGLAVSEQMRTQIRGLGKAKANAQDGIALLQIAEGAAGEITNILQRQRELAVQSSNDTLTSTERKYLDNEFQSLSKEINRIASSTNYNGMNLLDGASTSFGAVNMSGVATVAAGQARYTTDGSLSSKPFTLHVGPNNKLQSMDATASTDEVAISYAALTQSSLGLASSSITTQAGATDAIDKLDIAIKSVNEVRSNLGTYINRLEYTVSNIANLEYNTTDAESRIRDVDFAQETTSFTKNQILVQSSTAMLSQANSLPQNVLSLLG
jgi:flagellin